MTSPKRIAEPNQCSPETVPLVMSRSGISFCSHVLIGALVAVLVAGCHDQQPRKTRPNTDQKPDQTLSRLELQPLTGASEPVTLDDLTGQVVLINFWGTWCGPCVTELPDIAALEKSLRDQPGFKFLAVSYGREGWPEDVEQRRSQTTALLDEMGIDMPTYVDPDGVTYRAVDQAIGFEGYPTTLVLDRKGIIRRVWVGIASRDELEVLVTRLLEEE